MKYTRFGIDVRTKSLNNLLRRLERLVSTDSVENGGMYHMDKSYSQILVTTSKTEDELDHWLWSLKGPNTNYVGIFNPL